jgi:hypothetical protein
VTAPWDLTRSRMAGLSVFLPRCRGNWSCHAGENPEENRPPSIRPLTGGPPVRFRGSRPRVRDADYTTRCIGGARTFPIPTPDALALCTAELSQRGPRMSVALFDIAGRVRHRSSLNVNVLYHSLPRLASGDRFLGHFSKGGFSGQVDGFATSRGTNPTGVLQRTHIHLRLQILCRRCVPGSPPG